MRSIPTVKSLKPRTDKMPATAPTLPARADTKPAGDYSDNANVPTGQTGLANWMMRKYFTAKSGTLMRMMRVSFN